MTQDYLERYILQLHEEKKELAETCKETTNALKEELNYKISNKKRGELLQCRLTDSILENKSLRTQRTFLVGLVLILAVYLTASLKQNNDFINKIEQITNGK